MTDDPLLDALDLVLQVGRENVVTWMAVMTRAEEVRRQRRLGVPYTEMDLPDGVRLVDGLADNQRRLSEALTRLRDASILSLREEGVALAEIARRFGVSRQWVSRLLAELSAQP